ncbi:hypothetical protein BO83DRAFT_80854 [Aspergillus eucalypticola CBS 122712]|uniref:Transmembrane protein n=1 Tax=Aspergillus eucalypticola (strain CBS 122712 / IBT 29274) TaxID=1448314 RepID=A0A317WDT6_ASPEC|nr:uncharacterized protein BO83DRAFT_80854 [Aspergillus eucalypticola CBS 122712]PWY84135.1 hypothetical protein BO83DRAFT_80854 [Aspergillus eucalypticola CBS 122712]
MTEMESWVLGTGYTGSNRKLTQERERKEGRRIVERTDRERVFGSYSGSDLPGLILFFFFFCVVLFCASFGLSAYSAELESSLKGRWVVVAGVDFFLSSSSKVWMGLVERRSRWAAGRLGKK